MYTLPFLPPKPNQKAPHRHQTHRLSCMQLENGAPTRTGYAWGIISYYGDECIHLLELLKALTRRGEAVFKYLLVLYCPLDQWFSNCFFFPEGVETVWCMVCVNLYMTNVMMCLICTYYCRHHQGELCPSAARSSLPIIAHLFPCSGLLVCIGNL